MPVNFLIKKEYLVHRVLPFGKILLRGGIIDPLISFLYLLMLSLLPRRLE
jgi:hypothetical protein